MTTVVAGANGLVGSRIVARLVEAGERVLAVGRGPLRFNADVEYAKMDLLREPEKLAQLIESAPGGVINAAAMTDVDGCEKNPQEAWALNVRAVEIAALACSKAGTRLTTLSTDYVFDGVKGSYAEDDPPNPRGVYARTKRAGEEAALILASDVAVCRVAVVYSGHPGAKKTFAATALESLRSGKPVKAFTDQVVSPTLADNAAEMVIGVHRSRAQGVFHCGLLGESVPLPLDAALDRFLAESRT